MCVCVCVCVRSCVPARTLGGPVQLSSLVCRWLNWGLLNKIPFSSPLVFSCFLSPSLLSFHSTLSSFYTILFFSLSLTNLFLSELHFSGRFHLPVTSLAAFSLSSLHLLRAILGREEFSIALFSLSLLLYVPHRAQCRSYMRWLWNEMSLNRAMCPGATVIAGEIQLPL